MKHKIKPAQLAVLLCGAMVVPLARQEQDPQAAPVQDAQTQQSAAHIAAAFPRTRRLLNYLAREDAATFAAVIDHSARLAGLREEAALQFARQQHPELERLLQQLRGSRPEAYGAAIRQLLANVANLSQIRQRSEAEYEAALEEWKVLSQVRLVAAQLAQPPRGTRGRAALQRELTDLLIVGERANRRRIELQIARHEAQIERLRQRLDRDPLQYVERQRRNINRQRRGR